MARIFAADAHDHFCPYAGFTPCHGPKCMAWRWHGPSREHRETDNLADTPEGQRPVGVPPMPEGDGWQMDGPARSKSYHRSAKDGLPPASQQRWVRVITQTEGSCGRVAPDEDYPQW